MLSHTWEQERYGRERESERMLPRRERLRPRMFATKNAIGGSENAMGGTARDAVAYECERAMG